MTTNIVDLDQEREIAALITRLGTVISSDPDCADRTRMFLNEDSELKNEDSLMVSVRLPKVLVENLDECAREIAYMEKRRVTRSTLITDWLNTMLLVYQSRADVDNSDKEKQA